MYKHFLAQGPEFEESIDRQLKSLKVPILWMTSLYHNLPGRQTICIGWTVEESVIQHRASQQLHCFQMGGKGTVHGKDNLVFIEIGVQQLVVTAVDNCGSV